MPALREPSGYLRQCWQTKLDAIALALFVDPDEGRVIAGGAEPGGRAAPVGECPVEEPFGIFNRQVDAAVAHGGAEIVVPVGAVDGVAVVEVLDPGYLWQVVVGAGGAVAAVHGLGNGAGPDAKEAGDGGIVFNP